MGVGGRRKRFYDDKVQSHNTTYESLVMNRRETDDTESVHDMK